MKRISVFMIGYLALPLLMLNCNPTSDTTTTAIQDSITDADGNVYHTITIGKQAWTVENLRTTKYNDGTSLPLVTDAAAWSNLTTPGYCWYNNNAASAFGALYNWYAVDTKKLAPSGWHVASSADWDTLESYLITHGFNWDSTTTGNKVGKSLAVQTMWATDVTAGAIGNNLSKNNKSGFSAIPGGYRTATGNFTGYGYNCYWWSSTMYVSSDAFLLYLTYNQSNFTRYILNKKHGFSVRLIKDL